MPNDYKSRVAADIEEANKILRGEAPIQATKGVMTNAERRASIVKAFGSKPFGPDKASESQQDNSSLKSSKTDVGVPFKFGNNFQSNQD